MDVASGTALRAGLITTQSITQAQNRQVIAAMADRGARVVWAIADHAWCDGATGAEVRVTLTVVEKNPSEATLVKVAYTRYIQGEKPPPVVGEIRVAALNFDLTAHADVASAVKRHLQANDGLCTPGFKLHGAGFLLAQEEAERLLKIDERHRAVVHPFRNGKDLTARPRGVWVIDFGMRDDEEARTFPVLYNLVRDRVKPERDANPREVRRKFWWRFGEPNQHFRETVRGLSQYIATPETAKHRYFLFLDSQIAPDNKLVCICLAEPYFLGVMSSELHVTWSRAAGSMLEDKPVYAKTRCFDPFPFPDPPKELRDDIGRVAERLDKHRKEALARDERVTITATYNVIEKLRSGEALTPKEREIHQIAACGVLKDLHDELDRLVAEAYGWPWPMERDEILERLVALHDERVEGENRGIVRWLRPDYQIPRFAKELPQSAPALELVKPELGQSEGDRQQWPVTTVEQIAALHALISTASFTPEEAAAAFRNAKPEMVRRHLDTLTMVGEARLGSDGRYQAIAMAA